MTELKPIQSLEISILRGLAVNVFSRCCYVLHFVAFTAAADCLTGWRQQSCSPASRPSLQPGPHTPTSAMFRGTVHQLQVVLHGKTGKT